MSAGPSEGGQFLRRARSATFPAQTQRRNCNSSLWTRGEQQQSGHGRAGPRPAPIGGMSKRFVYILRSLIVPERRYVGLTSDVVRRLQEHNAGTSPFTAKFRPWVVTTRIEFEDERRAAAFERYLKSPSGRAFARRHFAVNGSQPPTASGR